MKEGSVLIEKSVGNGVNEIRCVRIKKDSKNVSE
jgi:hypothetical protein